MQLGWRVIRRRLFLWLLRLDVTVITTAKSYHYPDGRRDERTRKAEWRYNRGDEGLDRTKCKVYKEGGNNKQRRAN